MKKAITNLAKALGYVFIICSMLFSVMLLRSCAANADAYNDAESAAQRAFLIQSGLQKMQDDTLKYLSHTYVEPFWWTKDVGAVLGVSYKVYRQHKIELRLGHNWTLGISSDTGSVAHSIHF